MLEAILTAAISVTAIGLVMAIILVIAAKFMSVKEDARKIKLRECLPGVNCGACGYTGCDGYAAALSESPDTETNLCIPGGDLVSKEISDILGVEYKDTVELVATVHCCGDCDNTDTKAVYSGIRTCKAARMVYGGDGVCVYGCLGLGDCANVCPEDAISVIGGLAHVSPQKCIGCGLCSKACPNKLIHMMPDVKRTVVSCSNNEKGALARSKCKNACIACKKCENTCPSDAIKVIDNLAQIDYSKCTNCGKCAEACPVHCIISADYSGKLKVN